MKELLLLTIIAATACITHGRKTDDLKEELLLIKSLVEDYDYDDNDDDYEKDEVEIEDENEFQNDPWFSSRRSRRSWRWRFPRIRIPPITITTTTTKAPLSYCK